MGVANVYVAVSDVSLVLDLYTHCQVLVCCKWADV